MWDYDVYVDDVQTSSPQAITASLKEIELKLKQYGQHGWELVAVESLQTSTPDQVAMVHYLRKQ
jgi:hypothetical protein